MDFVNTNQPTTSLIGQRYKVVKTIYGGMGQIHFCEDTFDNHSPVALKTFKPQFLSDRTTREYFLREANIWIDIGFHPNIVQAYKVIHNTVDQSVHIVMQLVPPHYGYSDPSLRAQISVHKVLALKWSLTITLDIIRGMKFATSKIPGLVHRDLKPENILISLDEKAKITDFGLSGKSISEVSKIDASRLLTISCVDGLGTPVYMSPEQWLGTAIDCRSDIYAVGCILYEMITGNRVVDQITLNCLANGHVSGEALRNVRTSKIDAPIKILLNNCLDPEPDARYGSWDEIEKHVEYELSRLGSKPPSIDNSPIDVSLSSQYQKVESLLAIGSAYINLGDFKHGEYIFSEAEKLAEHQSFGLLNALAKANLGVTYLEQGQFKKAIQIFMEVIPVFDSFEQIEQVCFLTGNLGNAFFGIYDLSSAEKHLNNALELAIEIEDDINQARWMGNLGNVYAARGMHREALKLYQSALRISETSLDQNSICKHNGSIGVAYEGLGNFKKAEEYYITSLSVAKKLADRKMEGLLLFIIGSLYYKQQKILDGLNYLRKALEIGREINDKLLIAKASGNLATVFILKNQISQAVPLLEEAKKIAQDIDADDVYARACLSLGIIYEGQGKYNAAIAELRSAVLTFKSLGMPEYQPASDHLKQLRKALGLL